MKKTFLILLSTIMCLIVNAQYTALLDFAGTANGSNPWGDLVSDGTFLYGTTSAGGTSNMGIVFKIKPDGTGYVKLLDFTGSLTGSQPRSSLIYDGTFLYGMTLQGGIYDMGVIFRIKPDGTEYLKLLDFAGTLNGKLPQGSLLSDGTFLYGMTIQGGAHDLGVIFKIKPDGSGYVKLLDFAGTLNGSNPYGSLIMDGTFLCGMTYYGGANGMGTLFKIKPDGTEYANLLDFSGTSNGSGPIGSLISDGTFLYGMTSTGGTNNYGVVFKIKPDGTGYLTLLDFDNSSGDQPNGSLVYDGTYLYGMTRLGGLNSLGVIFKIKPDGTEFIRLYDFDGPANGREPFGSLITDGTFLYGMTYQGGTDNYGVIFKYGLITGIGENVESNKDISVFPNPFSSVSTLQLNSYLKNAEVIIYDVLGKEMRRNYFSGDKMEIAKGNLEIGIYFVKVIAAEKQFVQKIIIE